MKKQLFLALLFCVAYAQTFAATVPTDPSLDSDFILRNPGVSYSQSNYAHTYAPGVISEFASLLPAADQARAATLMGQMNTILAAERMYKEGVDFFNTKIALVPSDVAREVSLNLSQILQYSVLSGPGNLVEVTLPSGPAMQVNAVAMGSVQTHALYATANHYPRYASVYGPSGESVLFADLLNGFNQVLARKDSVGRALYELHTQRYSTNKTAVWSNWVSAISAAHAALS